MPDIRTLGSTNNLVSFSLKDATTGQGKQGVSSATAGLVISTRADNEAAPTVYTGANLETITTLGTFATPTSGKARIKKVSDANNPGLVEIQLDDARFAVSGSKRLVISVNDGQATILDTDYEIELTGPLNAPQVQLADGVAHGGTPGSSTATLALQAANITNAVGGDALLLNASGGGNGLHVQADSPAFGCVYLEGLSSFASCLVAIPGAGGSCVGFFGNGNAPAVSIAAGARQGVLVVGAGTRPAVQLGDGNDGAEGLLVVSPTGYNAVTLRGGSASSLGNGAALSLCSNDEHTLLITPDIGDHAGIFVLGTGTGAAFQLGDGFTGAEALKLLAGPDNTDAAGISITRAGAAHDVSLDGDGILHANLQGTIDGLTAAGLATLFTVDSTKVFSDAITGSPVKEIADHVTVVSGGTSASDIRTAVGLSTANLDTQLSSIQSDTDDIQARVPSALVGGKMDSSISAITAPAIAQLFTVNSAKTFADAIVGSAIKETVLGVLASNPTNFAALSIDATGHVKVQSGIKKNTALANFSFLMVDSTGAPKTGLTVTGTRKIDGGSFAACANAVSEVANGWYVISLAATDLNGDVIAFRLTASGAIDTDFTITTSP